MAQDTRKDPRAKVLSMTVRYKSATVDEFIEHHATDVGRGGIFIKTPSPFPPGTLLKFEIRIQDEQAVLAGVGRVVWKREPPGAGSDSPAGMGVKFIKIDEKSKNLISRLVDAHGGAPSAFEQGGGESIKNDTASANVAALAEAAKQTIAAQPAAKRATTMLGLGAIGKPSDPPKNASKPEPKNDTAEPKSGGFFPTSMTPSEERPPEERTVMKQAAELLQQALSEAGGSLAEVGTPDSSKSVVEAKSEPRARKADEPAPSSSREPESSPRPVAEAAPTPSPEPSAVEPVAAKAAAIPKPSIDDAPAPKPAAAKPAPRVEPAPVPASLRMAETEEKSGGAGKYILLLVAVAAALGGGYYVINSNSADTPATPTTSSYTVHISTSEPPMTATAKPTDAPTAATTAVPTATAAATTEPSGKATSEPTAKATSKPVAPPTPPPPVHPPPQPPTAQPTPPTPPPTPPPTAKPKPGEDIYGI